MTEREAAVAVSADRIKSFVSEYDQPAPETNGMLSVDAGMPMPPITRHAQRWVNAIVMGAGTSVMLKPSCGRASRP